MFGIDDLIGQGLAIINKFVPDGEAKAKAEAEYRQAMLTAMQASDTAQAQTNTEEAKNNNVFVAGWRPFLGWVCGSAFAWQFVFMPIANFALASAGHEQVALVFDTDTLSNVLYGMLGLGLMRSADKAVPHVAGLLKK